MSDLMKVSSNPHVRSRTDTGSIMLTVVIALLPAAGFGIYNFGLDALILILVTVASTVLTELLFEKICKRKITIGDYSAVVTGLLLALNLPASAPWWIGVVGGVFAILVVKMLFGGLGQNFMNPALGGRCFLLISFTSIMTNFDCDAYAGATPLANLKAGESVNILDMVIGRTSGTIGETSMIAIVAGACTDICPDGDHRPADSGLLHSKFCGLYQYFRRARTGCGLYLGTSGRRRPDAGRFLYGDGLCDQTDHEERTVSVRYPAGHPDGYFPYLRAFLRRRVLCDHHRQSACAVDREDYSSDSIW